MFPLKCVLVPLTGGAGVAGDGVGDDASGGEGVWGVAEAVGAGDEERALGAMRRSRDDGVLGDVGVVGGAEAAGGGVDGGVSGGAGGWCVAVAAGAGDGERVLGTMGRSRGDSVSGGVDVRGAAGVHFYKEKDLVLQAPSPTAKTLGQPWSGSDNSRIKYPYGT